MTGRAIVFLVVSVLSLTGCGYAVQDAVKTSGEAAERAAREVERSQSALVLAEDARNAARDAATAATAPPPIRDRNFIEDRANDAKDRADDAKDRADDAKDRAEDLRDRARDAEEGAKKASEWMADKGFYTRDEYWDCNRYLGSEAFEDQPLACTYANEARALAELVRWRANRAATVAVHTLALAYETESLALFAEAERRTGTRREDLLSEAVQLQKQAAEELAEVTAAYSQQNREWQQLQRRAGGWIEGAEQSYALLKDQGGGWGGLMGGLMGAAGGAIGAASVGATGADLAVATASGALVGTVTDDPIDAALGGALTGQTVGVIADAADDVESDVVSSGVGEGGGISSTANFADRENAGGNNTGAGPGLTSSVPVGATFPCATGHIRYIGVRQGCHGGPGISCFWFRYEGSRPQDATIIADIEVELERPAYGTDILRDGRAVNIGDEPPVEFPLPLGFSGVSEAHLVRASEAMCSVRPSGGIR